MNTCTVPPTLRDFAGLPSAPAPLAQSVVIVVDAQKEYREGALPLRGIDDAVAEISRLLERARAAGTPVIHVVHHGRPGGRLFNPETSSVEILPELQPHPGEVIVPKAYPNSFTGTTLEAELTRTGRKDLVVVGFMTHMCVNSTVRTAAEAGYRCTVVSSACATRDLPDGAGGVLPAVAVHTANLAALRDRFAVVVGTAGDIP